MESQQARVLISLRDMVLRGEFSAGERLAEVPLAERLKASRTPVRIALVTLEAEGLLDASPSGGYVVRRFTPQEIVDAISVRANLEGMAARLLAEHGVPRKLALELRGCLEDGDRILATGAIDDEASAAYIEMNNRFHALIVEGAGNDTLRRAVELINRQPFASPSALMPMQGSDEEARRTLLIAHDQHHRIVAALTHAQSARAQALAEEHGHIPEINLQMALARREEAAKVIPAMRLIVGGGSAAGGRSDPLP